MNVSKALQSLREYSLNNIKDKMNKSSQDDHGNRALILLCQERYNVDLGLFKFSEVEGFPPPPIETLRDAVYQSYRYDKLEELSEREYISNVLLHKNIDTDYYINRITYLSRLCDTDTLTEYEAYDLTHLCWALYMIGKDNHILQNFKFLMERGLICVYYQNRNKDVGTEALYFLSLISPEVIQEDWISDLEKSQLDNGLMPGDSEMQQVHHTGLSLLLISNF